MADINGPTAGFVALICTAWGFLCGVTFEKDRNREDDDGEGEA